MQMFELIEYNSTINHHFVTFCCHWIIKCKKEEALDASNCLMWKVCSVFKLRKISVSFSLREIYCPAYEPKDEFSIRNQLSPRYPKSLLSSPSPKSQSPKSQSQDQKDTDTKITWARKQRAGVGKLYNGSNFNFSFYAQKFCSLTFQFRKCGYRIDIRYLKDYLMNWCTKEAMTW